MVDKKMRNCFTVCPLFYNTYKQCIGPNMLVISCQEAKRYIVFRNTFRLVTNDLACSFNGSFCRFASFRKLLSGGQNHYL